MPSEPSFDGAVEAEASTGAEAFAVVRAQQDAGAGWSAETLSAVADEIGPELAVAWPPEWHVVTKDFDFRAVFFDDGEGIVGGSWFHGVVEFDVGNLFAPDDSFLSFRG